MGRGLSVKTKDSDGAQARSVGPESGPQDEEGEVRSIGTRKRNFRARSLGGNVRTQYASFAQDEAG